METEFQDLIKGIKSCRDCKGLFGFEPNPIVQGSQTAKILQISQAPSKNVQKTSKCFTDASGKKLRREWYQISDEDFYNENNFYITSIGHCYPGKDKNGGDKKPPTHCADKWLQQEIKLVQSKLIILIGSYAANYFFPKEDFSKLIFEDHQIREKRTIILPHPSPLNQKWFKDHPNFQTTRLPQIRKCIQEVLCTQK